MQKFVEKAHFVLMLPSLIITMVLVNQTDVFFITIGQLIGWLCYICAALVVFNSFQNKLFVYSLFLFIVVTKFLSILTGSSSAETMYIICQNTLFCIAGTVVAYLKPQLIYKQIMLFCILNVGFMLLQITGLGGKLAMIFTTHGEGPVAPEMTFFKEERNLNYLLIQGRPAGLTQANIILSLIIIFATAIHFSNQHLVYRWGTLFLSLLITLSMSKMAYLGLIVSSLIILIWGQSFQKMRVFRACLFIVFFILMYSLLFPGLAAVNLSKETIDASIFLRANDIMFAFKPENLSFESKPFFEGTSFFYGGEEGEFVSGIASVVSKVYNNLALFFSGLFVLFLLYLIGFRKLKSIIPSTRLKIITVLVVIGIFPVTHPIWPFQIYWFFLGYGLLPFYSYIHPKFFNKQTFQDS